MSTNRPSSFSEIPPHDHAVFSDQAARSRTGQPHHGGADVPVFGRGGFGHRLALHPYQLAGAVGGGDVLHRSHRRVTDGPHTPRRPPARERRHATPLEATPL